MFAGWEQSTCNLKNKSVSNCNCRICYCILALLLLSRDKGIWIELFDGGFEAYGKVFWVVLAAKIQYRYPERWDKFNFGIPKASK